MKKNTAKFFARLFLCAISWIAAASGNGAEGPGSEPLSESEIFADFSPPPIPEEKIPKTDTPQAAAGKFAEMQKVRKTDPALYYAWVNRTCQQLHDHHALDTETRRFVNSLYVSEINELASFADRDPDLLRSRVRLLRRCLGSNENDLEGRPLPALDVMCSASVVRPWMLGLTKALLRLEKMRVKDLESIRKADPRGLLLRLSDISSSVDALPPDKRKLYDAEVEQGRKEYKEHEFQWCLTPSGGYDVGSFYYLLRWYRYRCPLDQEIKGAFEKLPGSWGMTKDIINSHTKIDLKHPGVQASLASENEEHAKRLRNLADAMRDEPIGKQPSVLEQWVIKFHKESSCPSISGTIHHRNRRRHQFVSWLKAIDMVDRKSDPKFDPTEKPTTPVLEQRHAAQLKWRELDRYLNDQVELFINMEYDPTVKADAEEAKALISEHLNSDKRKERIKLFNPDLLPEKLLLPGVELKP